MASCYLLLVAERLSPREKQKSLRLSLQFPSSFPQAQHCLWVMDDGSATLEKLSCKRSKYARVQLTARRENSKHSLDP